MREEKKEDDEVDKLLSNFLGCVPITCQRTLKNYVNHQHSNTFAAVLNFGKVLFSYYFTNLGQAGPMAFFQPTTKLNPAPIG